jgi:hypothetical protein
MACGAGTIFSGQHFPLASGSKHIHEAIHYFSEWNNWMTNRIMGFSFGKMVLISSNNLSQSL